MQSDKKGNNNIKMSIHKGMSTIVGDRSDDGIKLVCWNKHKKKYKNILCGLFKLIFVIMLRCGWCLFFFHCK